MTVVPAAMGQALTLKPGESAQQSWQADEVFALKLSAVTGPVLVAVEEQGLLGELRGVTLEGFDHPVTINALDSFRAWEFAALTAEEAAAGGLTIGSRWNWSSRGAFKVQVSVIDEPLDWQYYRSLTLAAAWAGSDQDDAGLPVVCSDGTPQTASALEVASRCYQQAVGTADAMGELEPRVISRLYQGAFTAHRLGDNPTALEQVQNAYDLAVELPRLRSLAGAFLQLLMHRQGVADEQQQAVIDDMIGDLDGLIAEAPDHLGFRYHRVQAANAGCLLLHYQDRLDQAMKCYRAQLTEAQVYPGQEMNLISLRNNLAGIRFEAGEVEPAASDWEVLLTTARDKNNREAEALYLSNLGLARYRLRQYSRALGHLEAAAALRRELGDHLHLIDTEMLIAVIYRALGRWDRALYHYQLALELADSLGNREEEATVRAGIANVYTARGDHRQALEQISLALENLPADAKANQRATLLRHAARYALALQRVDAAADYLQQAETVQGELEVAVAQADHQGLKAEVALVRRQFDQARAYLSSAADHFAGQHDDHRLAEIRILQSELERETGNYRAAVGAASDAVDLMENLRPEIVSPTLRLGQSRHQKKAYRALVSALLAATPEGPSGQGARLNIFATVERSKAQTLAEERQRERRSADLSAALKAERETLAARLSGASATRLAALSEPVSATALNAMDATYFDALRALERFDIEHGLASADDGGSGPGFDAFTLALEDDELLLSYFILDRDILVTEVANDHFAQRRVPLADLPRQALQLLELVRRPGGWRRAGFEQAQATLSAALLPAAPLRARYQRLLISPDSWIWQLPFGILGTPQALLAQSHALVTIAGAGSLAAAEPGLADAQARVLAITDPVYSPDDQRLPASLPASATPSEMGYQSLSRLGGTSREGQFLRELMGESVSVYTGFEASREHIAQGSLAEIDLLHIATHGIFEKRSSGLSGLALSLFDAAGEPQPWLWQPQDIRALDLNADLVFLSACDTAQGELVEGEGIVGISRAFLEAGARSVVASTWKVSDRGTLEFVRHFYRAMLLDGRAPADALTLAARAMQSDRRYNDPYFWSGFTLHGHGIEPIRVAQLTRKGENNDNL